MPFEVVSDLASGLVGSINDMNECFETRLGVSFLHQFFDQFDRREDHALAGPSYMRKQAVFDGVPFGTIRRIMSDADFNTDLVGQSLQVLFEDEIGRASCRERV